MWLSNVQNKFNYSWTIVKILSDHQPGWETDRAVEDAADEDEIELRAEEAAELVADFKMPFLKWGDE